MITEPFTTDRDLGDEDDYEAVLGRAWDSSRLVLELDVIVERLNCRKRVERFAPAVFGDDQWGLS